MPKSSTNPKVDFFFNKTTPWQKEYKKLRSIMLDCGLIEELKWGVPCYTFEGSNVVLIHGFKEYCAILFVKGVLLKDTKNILIQQTENVQAGRQIRFTSLSEVVKFESTIKAYVKEAIEVEKAGLKVRHKQTSEYAVPEEFQHRLDESAALREAFNALTPGRQRAYLYYFAQPKLSKTRSARVENSIDRILDGLGLND